MIILVLLYLPKCGKMITINLTQSTRSICGAALHKAVGIGVADSRPSRCGPRAGRVLEPHDCKQVQDLALARLVPWNMCNTNFGRYVNFHFKSLQIF